MTVRSIFAQFTAGNIPREFHLSGNVAHLLKRRRCLFFVEKLDYFHHLVCVCARDMRDAMGLLSCTADAIVTLVLSRYLTHINFVWPVTRLKIARMDALSWKATCCFQCEMVHSNLKDLWWFMAFDRFWQAISMFLLLSLLGISKWIADITPT